MPRAPFPSGRKLLLLLIIALVIGGAWWWAGPPRDPMHRGQRLSKLVFGPEFWEDQRSGDYQSSREHIRDLSPAGVKWLAYEVEYGWRPPTRPGPHSFDRAPTWVRRWLPESWGGLERPNAVYERARAGSALQLLGADAAPAIPALVRGLQDSDEHQRELAARTLHGIGLATWPAVREILEHGDITSRLGLLETIPVRANRSERVSETEMALVIEMLIKLCGDPDPRVRERAAHSINLCHHYQPEMPLLDTTVPVFIKLLSDSNPRTQQIAAIGLAWRDAKGTPAIARLIELLDDPSAMTRHDAAFALGRVDQARQRSAARLRLMLHDPDSECVKAAREALEQFAHAHGGESSIGKSE